MLGLLVRGVKRDEIRRGMVMCKPGTHKMVDHVSNQCGISPILPLIFQLILG